jgi:hypothetical protein
VLDTCAGSTQGIVAICDKTHSGRLKGGASGRGEGSSSLLAPGTPGRRALESVCGEVDSSSKAGILVLEVSHVSCFYQLVTWSEKLGWREQLNAVLNDEDPHLSQSLKYLVGSRFAVHGAVNFR